MRLVICNSTADSGFAVALAAKLCSSTAMTRDYTAADIGFAVGPAAEVFSHRVAYLRYNAAEYRLCS